ncbi:MAG: aminodeoxychorismate/anthranilate synthase component II [Calditerrivibrio sp.]|nr:aminodeoxychorismate/anthranilate synthase component II [Calditerrivibrio sp.]
MYLLVDNYDSFTFNLKALFESVGAKVHVIKNDDYISADKFQGIILSPGPSNPTNAGTTLRYIEEYQGKKPIFGVCLGMQSISHVLGYGFRRAKSIMHGKVDTIKIVKNTVLLKGLPTEFKAVRYHSLVVDAPPQYVTSISMFDGEIMSFEDFERKLFGVQFHPESYLSEYGAEIAYNFINVCEG